MTQTPQYRIKSMAQTWFESLSFKNQEVIKWFNNTYGRNLSKERSWIVADFYQIHGPDLPVDVPLADKYEFAYDRFDEFKLYANARVEVVPASEGGAK